MAGYLRLRKRHVNLVRWGMYVDAPGPSVRHSLRYLLTTVRLPAHTLQIVYGTQARRLIEIFPPLRPHAYTCHGHSIKWNLAKANFLSYPFILGKHTMFSFSTLLSVVAWIVACASAPAEKRATPTLWLVGDSTMALHAASEGIQGRALTVPSIPHLSRV